jgi:hypothetical protein
MAEKRLFSQSRKEAINYFGFFARENVSSLLFVAVYGAQNRKPSHVLVNQ